MCEQGRGSDEKLASARHRWNYRHVNTYAAETDTEDNSLTDHESVKVRANARETLSETDAECSWHVSAQSTSIPSRSPSAIGTLIPKSRINRFASGPEANAVATLRPPTHA